MKKLTILGLLFFGFASQADAQEVKVKKTERITLVKSGPSEPVAKKNQTNSLKSDAEQIAGYEAVIKAIDQKEAWIKANPEELKLAQENGWFKEADATRAALKNKIQALK
jgi:hypothetical protein